jgi:two-component system, chemotaxis family, chemotaxis protein CheY
MVYSSTLNNNRPESGSYAAQGRVLVVDDEPQIRKLIRLTLAKAGYAVVEAADGAEAIDLMTSRKDSAMFDVVICDIRMPKVNGSEAVSYLRRQFPSVIVMVLTGFPDTKMAISLLKQGIIYIPKPVDGEKLLGFVARAMERRMKLRAG